jgi:hypothetical protein
VAEIRYIIDGKMENDVAISRLTTIAMPHRRATAQLRPRPEISAPDPARVSDLPTTQISSIEWLKKGLKTNAKEELTLRRAMLHPGWLHEMLVQANVIQPGEKARKERCFQDYYAQLLYIEGMKAVLGEDYDPRHAAREFGKNGKYKPTNKYKNDANPEGTFTLPLELCRMQCNKPFIALLFAGLTTNFLTIPYLLHAHGVARTTFQRMRKRGTANPPKQVPHNKGKRIIEDAKFEKTYNNPVRMFVLSKMEEFKKTEDGMTATAEDMKVSAVVE